jgi:hypothetical protein
MSIPRLRNRGSHISSHGSFPVLFPFLYQRSRYTHSNSFYILSTSFPISRILSCIFTTSTSFHRLLYPSLPIQAALWLSYDSYPFIQLQSNTRPCLTHVIPSSYFLFVFSYLDVRKHVQHTFQLIRRNYYSALGRL